MNRDFRVRTRWARSTPAQRAAWVRRYEQAGLPQKEFAQRHGLGLSTLRKWIAQPPPATPEPKSGPVWQEVKLPGSAGPPCWAVEIVRPDGLTVRLAPDAPAAWREQLLGAC